MPPLVLLHGWASDSRVFAALLAALAPDCELLAIDLPGFGASRDGGFPADEAQLLDALDALIPPGAVLLGWSLGGLLAIRLAARAGARIAGLVTLATNPCFAARAGWESGMDAATCRDFRAGFDADAARQLQRFLALQAQGDRAARELLRTLRAQTAECAGPAALGTALELLFAADARADFAQLACPSLHIHGEADAIVPAATQAAMRALQPRASYQLIAGCGHAPQLSAPAALAARIVDFLHAHCTPPAPAARAKAAVASAFARAAPAYEQAAHVQREIGDALLHGLPATATRVLDLGCGTGQFVPALRARFPAARLFALDIAPGMLECARERHAGAACWVGGDAEQLPFAGDAFDLVFSNLALQWSEDLPRALAELARVLVPGGRALVATLGPDTLWELRAAWRAVDGLVHVNRFDTLDALAAAAAGAGLRVEALEPVLVCPRYPSAAALARDLRAIGAHNLNAGRLPGLAGRARWRRLEDAYAAIAGDAAGLPATYQAVYLALRKPEAA